MGATKKHLDRDLIEYARDQLTKIAKRHVKAGSAPASAARMAIRETSALFPHGWRLAVQGDDHDDRVEVWEVDHKFSSPIASVDRDKHHKHLSHAIKRWNHRDVAQAQGVSENVVRRIYAAIQTAKKQGLYGGHTVDLIERSIGRRLMGGEYTVSAQAHYHLAHKPPSGYGGPKPRGLAARETPPVRDSDPRIAEAGLMVDRAQRAIYDVRRRLDPWTVWST